ncbi:septum site-determining protein MinC [Bacillaceae bacterium W0354]
MSETSHYITMKGTNNGIVVYLDDQCSFSSLLKELKEKVMSSQSTEATEVTLHSQYRYLQPEQVHQLKSIVEENSNFLIKKIDSHVLTLNEVNELYENTTVKSVMKTIRSGQVHHVKGDALIIGDVNPGGSVIATGNIFVLGKLRGIAHAGFEGDETCVVAASYMHPNQIRIGNKISRAPDYETEGAEREFAYVNPATEQIEVEQIQQLQKIRPNLLDVFERGL